MSDDGTAVPAVYRIVNKQLRLSYPQIGAIRARLLALPSIVAPLAG
jgi:hypothetical protein